MNYRKHFSTIFKSITEKLKDVKGVTESGLERMTERLPIEAAPIKAETIKVEPTKAESGKEYPIEEETEKFEEAKEEIPPGKAKEEILSVFDQDEGIDKKV